MVIHTERSAEEEQLVAALRAAFDASVMNFGSYNLLYARNLLGDRDEPAAVVRPEAGESVQENMVRSRNLLVGYRREPVEMVLCPISLADAVHRVHALKQDRASAGDGAEEYDGGGSGGAFPAEPTIASTAPVLVNLTNLAGMATEGSTVEIALSTGRRLILDVQETVSLPQLHEVPLHQELDVEDFYSFLDHFMDAVERTHSAA
ncbi:hypothetical protein [Nesterenkonia rhizosphaerae]|uniref:Uncharacterized protein n=1 Tax=Nesterenkonia rhizosphaerae TaxID=1348272 RepID=A0ABP9FZX6_9MICC